MENAPAADVWHVVEKKGKKKNKKIDVCTDGIKSSSEEEVLSYDSDNSNSDNKRRKKR